VFDGLLLCSAYCCSCSGALGGGTVPVVLSSPCVTVASSSDAELVTSVLGASTVNVTLFWLGLKSHCRVVQTG